MITYIILKWNDRVDGNRLSERQNTREQTWKLDRLAKGMSRSILSVVRNWNDLGKMGKAGSIHNFKSGYDRSH